MPYQRPFPYIKKFLLGRQTSVLYAVFCMLLCITPPSFSAEQFGPEASTVSPSIDSGPELAEGSAEPLTAEGLTAGGGWAATYGGGDSDHAASIHQTTDGGYIVAGDTESFSAKGDDDFWVLKLRPDGTVEWQKAYGGAGLDRAFSIQQTRDGGYIVVGETESFGAGTFDIWVLKLRPDGSVEWQKTYGGANWDDAHSIQQTADGGYVVVGRTNSFSVESGWVLKLRPDGSVEWQKVYGEVDMAYCAKSVHQTTDEGYIVAGEVLPFVPEDPDLWVMKLRPDGSVEWQKAYRGAYYDSADSIQQTVDGGYIVVGGTESFGVKGLWVLKLRPDGTIEWQKVYGGTLSLGGVRYSIQQTRDGGYIVASTSDCFGVDHWGDIWVMKLRPEGSIEWQRAYLGEDYDSVFSISQTNDEGYIVAGYTTSFGVGAPDLLVLKLDVQGSINPSCAFIVVDTYTSEINSDAKVMDTCASIRDSNINLQDSRTKALDTGVKANILCP